MPLPRATAASALFVSLLMTVHAQQPAPPAALAEFDVASVRLNTSGTQPEMLVAQPGGRFLAVNVPLRMVIRTAYQLQDDQIVGGPEWMASARVDIDARADAPGPPGVQLLERLQSLLTQRFGFQAHREQQDRPVYELVQQKEGAPAPALTLTACPDLVEDLKRPQPCANISQSAGRLTLRGMPMMQFLQFLAPHVNRVVLDRTGLSDRYDITLTWTPDLRGAAAAASADPNAISIFTAIQEQLGLRLQATRAPIDVLVIDRLERPSEN